MARDDKSVFPDAEIRVIDKQINEFLPWLNCSLKDMKLSEKISLSDQMFPGDMEKYFIYGKSALYCISTALQAASKKSADVKNILDLPCGHGRVLRALRAAFPAGRIHACDINRDGVDFCAGTFNAIPIYSAETIKEIPLIGNYDLIWVGSLFTHLDSADWRSFLELFIDHCEIGGIIVFTTAGNYLYEVKARGNNEGIEDEAARTMLEDFHLRGFGYANYPAARTFFHNTQNKYGSAIAKPSWVTGLLQEFPCLRLLTYTEAGWGGRQDVVSCIKIRDNNVTDAGRNSRNKSDSERIETLESKYESLKNEYNTLKQEHDKTKDAKAMIFYKLSRFPHLIESLFGLKSLLLKHLFREKRK
jgi:SAM-dependent methyltransferase